MNSHEPRPQDPEAILHRLPEREREEFLRQYRAAVEAARDDDAQYATLQQLLQRWGLVVVAATQPGYYKAIEDAKAGVGRYVPLDEALAACLPGKNLRAIRAALVVPQDQEAFDAGLDLVLAKVRATLDTAKLDEFVHTWWLIACDSVRDPQGRAGMYERAARIHDLAMAGAPLLRGGKTWRRLFAERGVEL